MIKTYIDVPRQDYIYHMVHDLITLDNGLDILTTIYKPKYVRFYFSYKWFQYCKVRALKRRLKTMKNSSSIMIHRIHSNSLLHRGINYFQNNAKKQSQDSATTEFKEILKAEMTKLQ